MFGLRSAATYFSLLLCILGNTHTQPMDGIKNFFTTHSGYIALTSLALCLNSCKNAMNFRAYLGVFPSIVIVKNTDQIEIDKIFMESGKMKKESLNFSSTFETTIPKKFACYRNKIKLQYWRNIFCSPACYVTALSAVGFGIIWFKTRKTNG
jgi:hypothetical protein